MKINKNVKMGRVFIEKRREKGLEERRKREELRNKSVTSWFVKIVEQSLVVE